MTVIGQGDPVAMKTCFLDISAQFGEKIFLNFMTLNMTVIGQGDLVAA